MATQAGLDIIKQQYRYFSAVRLGLANPDTRADIEVQRATDSGGSPGTYLTITTIPASRTSTTGFVYDDILPNDGTTYWYRYRLTGGNNTPSEWSEAVSTAANYVDANSSFFTVATTSSFSTTSSLSDSAISSSYALSGSYSFSGSYAVSSSFARSGSFATTASFASRSFTAGFANTAASADSASYAQFGNNNFDIVTSDFNASNNVAVRSVKTWTGGIVSGGWYTIASSSTSAFGRGAAYLNITSQGGTAAVDSQMYYIVTDGSSRATISLVGKIAASPTLCVNQIRVVRVSGSGGAFNGVRVDGYTPPGLPFSSSHLVITTTPDAHSLDYLYPTTALIQKDIGTLSISESIMATISSSQFQQGLAGGFSASSGLIWGASSLGFTINVPLSASLTGSLQGTASFANSASYALSSSQADVSTAAQYIIADDNRKVSSSQFASRTLEAGFGAWNQNNTSPYADWIHLKTYADASGGRDNLVMFKKGPGGASGTNDIQMRIWQGQFNNGGYSGSTYRDAVLTEVGSPNVVISGTLTSPSTTGSLLVRRVNLADEYLQVSDTRRYGKTYTFLSGTTPQTSQSITNFAGISPLPVNVVYQITAWVDATSTAAGWKGIIYSDSTTSQSVRPLFEGGTTGNHPNIFIDSNGTASISLYGAQSSGYNVRVDIEERGTATGLTRGANAFGNAGIYVRGSGGVGDTAHQVVINGGGTPLPSANLTVSGSTDISGTLKITDDVTLLGDITANAGRFIGVTKFDNIDLNGGTGAIIFNSASTSNLDHIWFDDVANSFNFVADTTFRSTSANGNISASTGVFGTAVKSPSITGSFTGSLTGLANSASFATSASYALTSSFATTSSFARSALWSGINAFGSGIISSSTQVNTILDADGVISGTMVNVADIGTLPHTILSGSTWYRIAEKNVAAGRGAFGLVIWSTGGTVAPITDTYYISKDWSSTGAITKLHGTGGPSSFYSQVRLVYDSGGPNASASVDIWIPSAVTASIGVSVFAEKVNGTMNPVWSATKPFRTVTSLSGSETVMAHLSSSNNTFAVAGGGSGVSGSSFEVGPTFAFIGRNTGLSGSLTVSGTVVAPNVSASTNSWLNALTVGTNNAFRATATNVTTSVSAQMNTTTFIDNPTIRKATPVVILNDTGAASDATTNTFLSFQRAGIEKLWFGFGDAVSGRARIRNTIGDVWIDASGVQGVAKFTGTDITASVPSQFTNDVTVGQLGVIDADVAPSSSAVLAYDGVSRTWKPQLLFDKFTDGAVGNTQNGDGTVMTYANTATEPYSNTPDATITSKFVTITPIYNGMIVDMSSGSLATNQVYVAEYATTGNFVGSVFTNATSQKVVHSNLDYTKTYYYRFYISGTTVSGPSLVASGSPSSASLVNAFGLVLASQIATPYLSAINADMGTITAGRVQNAASTASTVGINFDGTLPSSWFRYIDFTASGSQRFINVQPSLNSGSVLSITADGQGTFRGDVIANTVSASAVKATNNVLTPALYVHNGTSYDDQRTRITLSPTQLKVIDGASTEVASIGAYTIVSGSTIATSSVWQTTTASYGGQWAANYWIYTPVLSRSIGFDASGSAYDNQYTVTYDLNLDLRQLTDPVTQSPGYTGIDAETYLMYNADGTQVTQSIMSFLPQWVFGQNNTYSKSYTFTTDNLVTGSLNVQLYNRVRYNANNIVFGNAFTSSMAVNSSKSTSWRKTSARTWNRRGLKLTPSSSVYNGIGGTITFTSPHLNLVPGTNTKPADGAEGDVVLQTSQSLFDWNIAPYQMKSGLHYHDGNRYVNLSPLKRASRFRASVQNGVVYYQGCKPNISGSAGTGGFIQSASGDYQFTRSNAIWFSSSISSGDQSMVRLDQNPVMSMVIMNNDNWSGSVGFYGFLSGSVVRQGSSATIFTGNRAAGVYVDNPSLTTPTASLWVFDGLVEYRQPLALASNALYGIGTGSLIRVEIEYNQIHADHSGTVWISVNNSIPEGTPIYNDHGYDPVPSWAPNEKLGWVATKVARGSGSVSNYWSSTEVHYGNVIDYNQW